MDSALENYEVTSWFLFDSSFFEVSFVQYEYCYHSFPPRPCSFAWNICYPPSPFNLCRSFVLRWVSCWQHMCGSCFLIHLAILCLLIGAFNPFTFKVIIGKYLFIAIFLYLCSFLFSFLSLKQSRYHLFQSWFGGGVFF